MAHIFHFGVKQYLISFAYCFFFTGTLNPLDFRYLTRQLLKCLNFLKRLLKVGMLYIVILLWIWDLKHKQGRKSYIWRVMHLCAKFKRGHVCWLAFLSPWQSLLVNWEEGTSSEDMPPSDWSVGKSVVPSLIGYWSPTVGRCYPWVGGDES